MASCKRLISFIVVSTLTSIASLVIAAVFSMYVPKVVQGPDPSVFLEAEQIFSQQQLDEVEREFEEKIRLQKEEDRKKGLKGVLQEFKEHAIYVSWFPWLLVPFFLRINHCLWGLVLLSVPVVLVPTGLFLPIEVVVIGGCLYLGNQIERRIILEG